jgi:hypothetical protein
LTERIAEEVTLHKRVTIQRTLAERPRQNRKSPILRKCEDLMETLWNDGYRKQITWSELTKYVKRICGGFRTTLTDYMGRLTIHYKSRGREGCIKYPAKKGYLEDFGFIERHPKNPRLVFLLHEKVNRPYHCAQVNVDSFSLSLSARQNENLEATENVDNTTTTTKSERETKPVEEFSQLSPIEETILRAKPSNKQEPLQR